MPEITKSVTIRDVARHAGVSIGAVSKVLHGNASTIRVGEATAKKIRESAESLSYRPNPNAQSLRSGRSRSLVIAQGAPMAFAQNSVFFAAITDHLVLQASKFGYTTQLLTLRPEDTLVNDNLLNRADGVIWISGESSISQFVASGRLQKTSVAIQLNEALLTQSVSVVGFSEEKIMRELKSRLEESGAKKVLLACSSSQTAFGALQLEGLQALSKEIGFEVFGFERAVEVARHVADADYDAVIVWSVNQTELVEAAIQFAKPDLKVIGMSARATLETTDGLQNRVDIPVAELAQSAVELLLRSLNEPEFKPEIIHHEATLYL
jgi:DNA-binding LacI/PurR family transcriptional regulator